mgnify:CR=1 FL=1
MRKKILRAVLIVIVLFFVCEGLIVAVSSYVASRNKKWGLKLSVEEVTSSGLTLTAQRSNSEISGKVIVDKDYRIQKWTLFGWKYVESTSFISTGELPVESVMEEGDSWTRELRWENRYGKLRAGIYRITDRVTSYDSDEFVSKDGKEVDKDFNLYATFLVFF